MSGAVAPILAKCWEQFGVNDTSLGKAKYPYQGNHPLKKRDFGREEIAREGGEGVHKPYCSPNFI